MKQNYLLKLFLIGSLVFLSEISVSQCTAFVKKKCLPNIQPFTLNGQANILTLTAGQKTSLNLTFSSGQAYRILICSEEHLGVVTFKVYDLQRNVVFDSRKNDFPDFWDFKVKNTQQFIVEVQVPESTSTSSILPTGCVSIMIGFK